MKKGYWVVMYRSVFDEDETLRSQQIAKQEVSTFRTLRAALSGQDSD